MPTRNEHTAREAFYTELQLLPDGHEALWIQVATPTGEEEWYCFFLPVGKTFMSDPMVTLIPERVCMEMHCQGNDHEHLIGSADCSWEESEDGGIEPKLAPQPNPAP